MTLAFVTGASTGIGPELARLARGDGYRIIIVADEPAIHQVAAELGAEAIEADLAMPEGVSAVVDHLGEREIDVLMLNAGTGLGHAFLDQDPRRIDHVVMTNILGVLRLILQRLLNNPQLLSRAPAAPTPPIGDDLYISHKHVLRHKPKPSCSGLGVRSKRGPVQEHPVRCPRPCPPLPRNSGHARRAIWTLSAHCQTASGRP